MRGGVHAFISATLQGVDAVETATRVSGRATSPPPLSANRTEVQGYLAHKKHPPPRTLQYDYVYGPLLALRRGGVSYDRVTRAEGVNGVETARSSGRATSPPTPTLLAPSTVELIPTPETLSPRDGPVQDPVLTPSADGAQVTGTVPACEHSESRIRQILEGRIRQSIHRSPSTVCASSAPRP